MLLATRTLLELCETLNHFLYFGNHYKMWSNVANMGSIYRRKCYHNNQIAKSFLHAKIFFSLQKLGGISVTDLTTLNKERCFTGMLSSQLATMHPLLIFGVTQGKKKHVKNTVFFLPAFLIATYPFCIIALNRISFTLSLYDFSHFYIFYHFYNNTRGKLLLLKPTVIFVCTN